MAVVWYGVLILVLLAFVAILAAMVVGVYWSLLMVTAVLLAVVVYHLYCLHWLIRWLKSPTTHPPTRLGVWQHVFGELVQQHKKQEKYKRQLKAMIERFNRMITAIPCAVMMIDKSGKIIWHNALAKNYFKLSKTNKRQKIKHCLSAFDDGGLSENIKQGHEIKGIKIQSDERTLLLSIIPVEAKASMLIAYDITIGEQLDVSKNAFVANVSHELRTPLTAIYGFLEIMQDTPDLEMALRQDFVGLMQKESKRMLDLVEDLLILSRLENDEHYCQHFEPVDLSALTISAAQDAKAMGTAHQITTGIDADLWVFGGYKELYSVVSNLIVNAIHHTKDGTPIHISLTKQGKQVLFAVQDWGEGIAKKHLKHLTERFYRVDKGRSRQTGGSGLGLAIVKHTLTRHKATLDIQSALGQGSTFSVVFDACQGVDGGLLVRHQDKQSEAKLF